MEDFSDRLRTLKDQRRLTTAQIAGLTGIPKRTLDKYLAKIAPAQPSADAIRAICHAFSISADWLLGIDATWSADSIEVEATERAAHLVIEQFVATLISLHRYAEKGANIPLFEDGRLLGATASEIAADYAYRVVKLQTEMLEGNVPLDVQVRPQRENDVEIQLDPPWPFKSPSKAD